MKVIMILCLAAGAAGLEQSRFGKRRGASRPLCLLDSGFSFSEVRERHSNRLRLAFLDFLAPSFGSL